MFRIIAITMLLVSVLTAGCGRDNTEDESEQQEQQEASVDGAVEAPEPEEPNNLEPNSHPSVDRLINKYLECLASGDVETLESLVDILPEGEAEKIQSRSRIIEGYENVNCYTKKGSEEDSYIVFVCYDMKLVKIDTPAPDILSLYVGPKDEDGNRRIHYGGIDESMEAYVQELEKDPEVQALFNDVNARYQAAKESDEALADYLKRISGQIAEEEEPEAAEPEESEGGEPEVIEAEEGGEEPEPEPQEAEATSQNRKTRMADTANVRKEPSTEAERLAVAYLGEEVTQIESYDDGWSKVEYMGVTGYVKTEFLE